MPEITCSRDGLSVSLGGLELFSHSPSRPLIELGTARCDFRTHKLNIASYKIRISKKRMRPLKNITGFTRGPGSATVCFDNLLALNITEDRGLL